MVSDIADQYSSIAETAAQFGVSLRTLRFYEQAGFILPQKRGSTRLYDAKDRIKIQLIVKGKRLGFSLREIDSFIKAHIAKSNVSPDQMTAMLDRETIKKQLDTLLAQSDELQKNITELRGLLT